MNKIRFNLTSGLLAGFVNVFFVLLGLTGLVGLLVQDWFDLSSQTPGAWVLLLLVALWGGSRAARNVHCETWTDTLVGGLVTGAAQGALLAAFVGLVASMLDSGADVRKWLVQIYPEAIDILRFGQAPFVAALIVLVLMAGTGLLGAALAYAAARYHWREKVGQRWEAVRNQVTEDPRVHQVTGQEYFKPLVYVIGLAILLLAPLMLGRYWNYTLGTVGIYVVLGLGLNIVVGFSGLLNLGYAAFFAIGAYTVAILTAPQYPIQISFWIALPVGVILATVTGVLLALPVLRMRGDYLAIVTLGFGEIIRILAKSDALIDLSGGPRGIRAVGGPTLFGEKINSEFYFMYLIILSIVLGIFVTYRLQHSRVGRAWAAMREDEDVAQAVGIYTLKYKVLAFAIGAAFAGLGGVIFASRNKFTGPEDFTLLVSINVLCLVIIGGMGSIPGVVVGSMVLKGLPEILRQLSDYRMLAFGALLVIMMIVRPEGLWPPARRKLELKTPDQEKLPSAPSLRQEVKL